MIAGVVADAIAKSKSAKLVAVSSRRIDNARNFVAGRGDVTPIEGVDALLARPDVEAIYVATPTVAKEQITLAAIAAGKHVLVDKPYADSSSLWRMTDAAAAKGVVFMDATHFVHHPRTMAVQVATVEKIGQLRSLHTAFYFPFSDRNNIRFDPKQEPMTALGDMAWYSMRAIVEYLRPSGSVAKAMTVPERDTSTNAIIRASGIIAFESGEVSTYDVGYTADTVLMDLQLLGTTGVFEMDDFVLDWNGSFAFREPIVPVGYVHRTAMAVRKDWTFIATPTSTPQEVLMIEDFADLANSKDARQCQDYIDASLKTQEYLDAAWRAVTG
jgi:predicted dehydrogenase